MGCICIDPLKIRPSSSAKLKAKPSFTFNSLVSLQADSNIKCNPNKIINQNVTLNSYFTFKNINHYIYNPYIINTQQNGNIRGLINISGVIRGNIDPESNVKVTYTDKICGNVDELRLLGDFVATQKLYPIGDIVNDNFVNQDLSDIDLYNSIDEGVILGDYVKRFGNSNTISDGQNTFIQPSAEFTGGNFNYKIEITPPSITPKETFLLIRAAGPKLKVPPEYTLSNLNFTDPSGNIIAKYNDIIIRGDANFNNLTESKNFATYISSPEINNAKLYQWQSGYPIFGEASGYYLNIDLSVQCLDDPFKTGFSDGYQGSCSLETHPYNSGSPVDSLRISAIEIINSGALSALLKENYLGFYSEVQDYGNRITKYILPSRVLTHSFDTNIAPSVETVWQSSPDLESNVFDNQTSDGSLILTDYIRDKITAKYITLNNSSIENSGKLILEFSHESPDLASVFYGGAFNFGQRTVNKEFDYALRKLGSELDTFFTIDNINLKVIAKKEIGSRDYVLDVVGYSNDKILNITPAIGGFLQNTDGTGSIPIQSGFLSIDDLGISTESISDKNQYFESYTTNNAGGDHYLIADLPVVSGTSFQEYTIPLKIYEDNVTIGRSIDYSMSSYFEHLYLDIYPLPTGASIAYIALEVQYKPSNTLPFNILGHGPTEMSLGNVHLFPSQRKSNDHAINTQSSLSLVDNIPQAFSTSGNIKTNYSRRWRGVDGNIVNGPFIYSAFDFSFYNPQILRPFIDGFYNFDKIADNFVLSNKIGDIDSNISGLFTGDIQNSLIKNIGLRFNSDSLFDSQERLYKTIDWTYSGHELHNKLFDAFDNALRVSGIDGYINFGSGLQIDNGFSVYARFSPDNNVSGVNYNLWDSGVILSKWDSGKDLEFAVAYENGYLCGYAKDTSNNIIKIQDTIPYTEYQYPLSVLLTYNDKLSSKLKLYADNELISGSFNILRAESSAFTLYSSDSNITAGYCDGSGVGFNGFITEIGLSSFNDSGNYIVENDPITDLQQTSAISFFDTHRNKLWYTSEAYTNDRYKLWSYVDENSNDWHIGDFNLCYFNQDYDRFTKRIGNDLIVHQLTNDGQPYENITNIALPINIPSGVSYHSQIENDSLRFNLSHVPDSFGDALYSAYPRISKNLPRGYNFTKDAIAVDTILEYHSDNDIIWPNSNLGPKLIVSLYTDTYDNPSISGSNLGLVGRNIHYLEPSSCFIKLTSSLNYDSITNQDDEPWSNFTSSQNHTEIDTKYYSTDINNLFLQYDLAYPSGSSFESTIKLHSCHVRLDNALVKSRNYVDDLNLFSSGKLYQYDMLSMFTYSYVTLASGLNLIASGQEPIFAEINLYTSGEYLVNNQCNLYTTAWNTTNKDLDLYISGKTSLYNEEILNLYTLLPSRSYNDILNITISSEPIGYKNKTLELRCFCEPYGFLGTGIDSSHTLFITGSPKPLQTFGENAGFNLFVGSYPKNISNDLTLYISTKLTLPGQQYAKWNTENPGLDILVDDNLYATLAANDEIRGVDLITFGNCGKELKVQTHDIVWYEPECVDAGIFRALNTYTNLMASGFNSDVPYSGHFYGIRKYVGLVPNSRYNVTIYGKTGSNTIIDTPKTIQEIEYGSNDEVDYSGVKLLSSYDSLEQRNDGDLYGSAISNKDNLLAIGAPGHNLLDSGNYLLNNAGAVFVYRRDPSPSGFDWTNQLDKSEWNFETKLTLPSGFLRDYYTDTEIEFTKDGVELPFVVNKRQWLVGQEGRNFGKSIDIAKPSGLVSIDGSDKEIIVVGAPSCGWSRTFEESQPSGVNIGLFIFTDEFTPINELTYLDILNSIQNKDLLFKYFSSPPISFNVKLIIYEPKLPDLPQSLDFSEPKPDFIIKKTIDRHSDEELNSELYYDIDNRIYSGIKEAFYEAFPYDETKLNNNIPPVIGVYIDDSRSLGTSAVQPAIDKFINYYKSYSFNSGLVDFFGTQSSGVVTKYSGTNENWIAQSISILNEVLDTGNLVSTNNIRFLTSGITEFNDSTSEFHIAPPSGGAVYIFEKESGVWNIIQTINSPTLNNNTYPDQFGHSVKISENGEILVIGSPYIDECVGVYQYNNQAKKLLYSYIGNWLANKRNQNVEYAQYYTLYNNLTANHSQIDAAKILYNQLSPDAKYQLRLDSNIQEYEKIFTYNYSKINYGAWSFLVEDSAPLSRLGYSVAVNEDGSIFAAGAPTDSFNEFDSSSSYYAPGRPQYTTWPTYVNAGSVRIFESRKYFPHNLAIEYGKFGNLEYSRSLPEDSGLFNHMEKIFNERGIDFRKTSFTETEIPDEAGLVFIINPEVDALSDEIFDNIKNWLSLGDRNLVLVGNDPIWESNGIYRSSNNIINKILNRLKSRLRIHPARNENEALLKPCDGTINICKSFTPTKSLKTYIVPTQLRGRGVGDIRVHYPGAERTYDCTSTGGYDPSDPLSLASIAFDNNGQDISYKSANSKCEIPIKHNGDLRSEWAEWCVDKMGNPITYKVNWALYFDTVIPSDYGCDEDPNNRYIRKNTVGYDPVPILAAAEYVPEKIIVSPGVPPGSSLKEIGKQAIITDVISEFADPTNNEIEFQWNSTNSTYKSLNLNITDTNSPGKFFDPPSYNNKDAILQAKAVSTFNTSEEEYIIIDKSYYASEEIYSNTTSKIILIAGLETESKEFLYAKGDFHINFYNNMVSKNKFGQSYIAQLNAWTTRTSFKDGYDLSILDIIFKNLGNKVKLNVTIDELSEVGHPDGYQYDVCWIANAYNLPSEQELKKLKSWLNLGNKKLIITYSNDMNDISSKNFAKQLCELLNISMKPLYLTNKSRFAVTQENFPATLSVAASSNIIINPESYLYNGYVQPRDVITELYFNQSFTPIEINNGTPLAYNNTPITDFRLIPFGEWSFKTGTVKVDFDVTPSSSYRIYFDFASENIDESEALDCYIANCVGVAPTTPLTMAEMANKGFAVNGSITDIDYVSEETINIANVFLGATIGLKPNTFSGNVETNSVDIYVPSDITTISIYINRNKLRIGQVSNNYVPKTTRLISVSGTLLNTRLNPVGVSVPVFDWFETPGTPQTTTIIPPTIREISTDNSKYCPDTECVESLGNQPIADGPIVVAQELEILSTFENGVNRSRITVISDSSLVQGHCMVNENGAIYPENITFLQSLYPFTTFPSKNKGRSFNIQNKVHSPERASPGIYFNSTGNSGINLLFNSSNIEVSGKELNEFISSFEDYATFKHAFHPAEGEPLTYTSPRQTIITSEEQLNAILSGIKKSFRNQQAEWGASSKFMGYINGTYYEDAGPYGGIPKVMQDTHHDYLDFNFFTSGYPGDLFGYSIDLKDNKLVVGSPFTAYSTENILPWSSVKNIPAFNSISGTIIGYNGGAGSVYVFEKTGKGKTEFGRDINWECVRKIRPDSINIGQDLTNTSDSLSGYSLGLNNYSTEYLTNNSIIPDQFGHTVKLKSDTLLIGAPGHDFDNQIIMTYNSGCFIRKEFDLQFDIPKRQVIDLGNSGVRNNIENYSGCVLNNGAIYIYENRITNWSTKEQSWVFAEKLVENNNTRLQQGPLSPSGSENNRFGEAISIDRLYKTDADYTIAIGCKSHIYDENNNISIHNAGASYIYDIMLRPNESSLANPNNDIFARIFGLNTISTSTYFTNSIYNNTIISTGYAISNNEGELFIEASGQDYSQRGYMVQRPYIDSVELEYVFGREELGVLNFIISGIPKTQSGIFNLFSNAADYQNVYNNIDIYTFGITDNSSGNITLYTHCPNPSSIANSGLSFFINGLDQNIYQMNMFTAGY